MKITSKICLDGSCCIEVDTSIKKGLILPTISYNTDNAIMEKLVKIVKHFAKGDKMFFGHYRTDGIYLTEADIKKYENEIPEYYQSYGEYEQLSIFIQKGKKTKIIDGCLTVGSLTVNNGMFKTIPKLFRYYLDTICFCPKISFEKFKHSYCNYMEHAGREYVMNGFTDFLFSHYEGRLSISFNPNIYDKDLVYQEIKSILLN